MALDGRLLGGIGVLAAVAEAGSFARAAGPLGITPSGVSRAVARLEERVGVRLFQRSARAVVLTDEGRRLHALVAPLLGAIEDAAGEVGGSLSTPKGLLRVSVDALTARAVVGPRVSAFLDAHPQLSLDLVVRDRLGDMIADGYDVSVRFGEPEPSSLIARKLLETRVLTFASRRYLARAGRPKHPSELERHECIHFRDPQTGRPFEWIFRRGAETIAVNVAGRLTVNDGAARLAACLAGRGVVQMLELEARAGGGRGLVRLLPGWDEERFPLYAYYPSRNLPPAKVRAFVDFVARLPPAPGGPPQKNQAARVPAGPPFVDGA